MSMVTQGIGRNPSFTTIVTEFSVSLEEETLDILLEDDRLDVSLEDADIGVVLENSKQELIEFGVTLEGEIEVVLEEN